jgi:hypothetical protein
MTFYPVTVREMRELSLINAFSVAFFSLGSFFLSLAIGFWEGAVFAGTGPISPEGAVLKWPGSPIAFGMAVVFYVLGIAVLILRGRTVDDIRKESSQITAEVRMTAAGNPPANL